MKTTAPHPVAPQDIVYDENGIEKIAIQFRKRRNGGQPGNRNAFKTGHYTKEPRALCKQIAAWKRTTRALLDDVTNNPSSAPPPIAVRE